MHIPDLAMTAQETLVRHRRRAARGRHHLRSCRQCVRRRLVLSRYSGQMRFPFELRKRELSTKTTACATQTTWPELVTDCLSDAHLHARRRVVHAFEALCSVYCSRFVSLAQSCDGPVGLFGSNEPSGKQQVEDMHPPPVQLCVRDSFRTTEG